MYTGGDDFPYKLLNVARLEVVLATFGCARAAVVVAIVLLAGAETIVGFILKARSFP
jgi:hypothetical protein